MDRQEIKHWENEGKKYQNSPQDQSDSVSVEEEYQYLRKREIESSELKKQLKSLEESAELESEMSSFASIDQADENEPLPRQQNHQEASKEKEGPKLGKFGKFISRILSEKFINNHMSESFNVRYLNTKKATLKKKINVLNEIHETLVSDKQKWERELDGDQKILKHLPEKDWAAIEQRDILKSRRLRENINKTNKSIERIEDYIKNCNNALNYLSQNYRQKPPGEDRNFILKNCGESINDSSLEEVITNNMSEYFSDSYSNTEIDILEKERNDLDQIHDALIVKKQLAEKIVTQMRKNFKGVQAEDPRFIDQREALRMIARWEDRINEITESIKKVENRFEHISNKLNFLKDENVEAGTQ